eukprot:6212313-Pleurochrysis_carterae.AAC.10
MDCFYRLSSLAKSLLTASKAFELSQEARPQLARLNDLAEKVLEVRGLAQKFSELSRAVVLRLQEALRELGRRHVERVPSFVSPQFVNAHNDGTRHRHAFLQDRRQHGQAAQLQPLRRSIVAALPSKQSTAHVRTR